VLPEAKQLATVVVCEDDEATLELFCDHLTADHDRVRGLARGCRGLRGPSRCSVRMH
jgi:hypothetical protein